jgi:hypothetical protein
MKLHLDPGEPDWKFGDVLRLHTHDRRHEYLYMFVYRKPRMLMGASWNPPFAPNDRGFAAMCLGVPDCAGCSGFDHERVGSLWASYGGLPFEDAWEVVSDA